MKEWGVFKASIVKDFKIVLRNWQTTLSIMILPFILIAVIGIVFSSGEGTVINVGLEGIELDFIEPMRSVALVEVDDCRESILSRQVKACILRTDERAVTVLIDNTDVNLYPHIISLIQRGFERSNRNIAMDQIGRLQGNLQQQIHSLDDIVIQVRLVDVLFEEQKREFINIGQGLNHTIRQISQKHDEIMLFNEAVRDTKKDFEVDKEILESDIRLFRSDLLEIKSTMDRIDMNELQDFDSVLATEVGLLMSKVDDAIRALDMIEDNLDRNMDMYMLILGQGENMQKATEELLIAFEMQSQTLSESAERLDIVQNTSQDMTLAIEGIKDASADVLNFSAEEIVNSLASRFEPVFDLDIRLLLMPVVLMMVIVFLSMTTSSLLGYEELSSKAMIRIELSQTSRALIDLSKLIIILSVVIFNVTLLVLFSSASWGIGYGGNILQIIGYSLLGALTFSCIGLGLSYLVKKPFLLFITSTFISLMFIVSSGILRPKELLSASRALLVEINAAAMVMEGIRALIYGTQITGILIQMIIAAVLSVAFLVAARIYWKKSVFKD
ncbi:MAG: ABC transporter permease [Candidatus Woesearchaeota archaeon]